MADEEERRKKSESIVVKTIGGFISYCSHCVVPIVIVENTSPNHNVNVPLHANNDSS